MKQIIKRRICIMTATRAEYGLLRPVIEKLMSYPEIDARVAVTGTHLCAEFGMTVNEIEADGIPIDRRIDMLLASDSPAAVTKSMALCMAGFADYFAEMRPDALVILGDRYEALAVAIAAMNARIPIVHLFGGDVSEGAVDDAVRHAITKLSYLHFTATERQRRRIIQLGESPERVWCVGAMAVENARMVERLSRVELVESLGFDWGRRRLAVVTFHPVTLESHTAGQQFQNLLDALSAVPDLALILTKANADADGRVINRMIDAYAAEHPQTCLAAASLGVKRYLSAVALSDVVVGNSSSGIAEVPALGVPVVDIGDRQKGREQCDWILHCGTGVDEIIAGIEVALSPAFRRNAGKTPNPYEKDGTSGTIAEGVRHMFDGGEIELKKKFYDL